MGSNGAFAGSDVVDGLETTIEIKIKTLDSQTHTLRVDKQMPVPALKDQIASVTGVLSEQQRLICRGKVLTDDELLSAYHVEDGHTLHMVVRQPIQPSPEGLPNHPASDPASSTSHSQNNPFTPGVVIETFNVPFQGEGGSADINRILSAILGSIGISNTGSSSEGNDEHGPQRLERTLGTGGMSEPFQLQPEQGGMRSTSQSGLSSLFSLGHQPSQVIPDSLTTLFLYLNHIRREFQDIERDGGSESQVGTRHGTEEMSPNSAACTESRPEGFPTPATLAEVMLSTRQMLIEQAAESLHQIARQLESQENVSDPLMRSSSQNRAVSTGRLFHNLGAFFLEIGRTIMTLRLGQTLSEAVVNAGPAVFVSPNGPNPIMVQPLPFQAGTSYGAIPLGAVQPGSDLINGLTTRLLSRRVDIQIRRGLSAASNVNRDEHGGALQPSGQRRTASNSGGETPVNQASSRSSDGPAVAGDSGVRIMPLRSMVAALSGPSSSLQSDSSGQSQTPNRQHVPLNARSVSINVISAGGLQNNHESDQQLPSSIIQFLRNNHPGGEILVEDGSVEEMAVGFDTNQARPSSNVDAAEAEPVVSDEGIFLSNMLRQIMPIISEQAGPEQANDRNHTRAQESSSRGENSNAGTLRRQSGHESDAPSSKRQKME